MDGGSVRLVKGADAAGIAFECEADVSSCLQIIIPLSMAFSRAHNWTTKRKEKDEVCLYLGSLPFMMVTALSGHGFVYYCQTRR